MLSERLALFDDDDSSVADELLLTDKDFPANYIDKHHPDDYNFTAEPIEKEHIIHEYQGRHPRFLLRCSVKLAEDVFCSMTFVLDTGAPKIYVSTPAKVALKQNKILLMDDDLGVVYLVLMGRKYRVADTPAGHAPANIIGLKTLCRWGLEVFDEPCFGFRFKNDFDYLEV